jgi:sterol desaturase/sphingolipid hydroxylase (fatty acid hydroxylase superfamily)
MNTFIHFLNYLTAGQLVFFTLCLGVIEFSFGLYERHWTKNERYLDVACFILPRLVLRPATAYLSFKLMSVFLPHWKNTFHWVPFFWGFFILCVADDLTQYWYHRLHHEIPWLWRFHRTHHSAPYMGMAMASRQNLFYTFFFSQTYVISALVYLGLGAPAIVVGSIKGLITTLAHSSIPWDKPLYRYRVLHPVAWVVERVISTPATHHAHHADSTDDGIGYYKGNFGNMFFIWDVIFGTALITRQYPKTYGVSHYEGDEWYAQLLWPILKSGVAGSELAPNGPMVREDLQPAAAERHATTVQTMNA